MHYVLRSSLVEFAVNKRCVNGAELLQRDCTRLETVTKRVHHARSSGCPKRWQLSGARGHQRVARRAGRTETRDCPRRYLFSAMRSKADASSGLYCHFNIRVANRQSKKRPKDTRKESRDTFPIAKRHGLGKVGAQPLSATGIATVHRSFLSLSQSALSLWTSIHREHPVALRA